MAGDVGGFSNAVYIFCVLIVGGYATLKGLHFYQSTILSLSNIHSIVLKRETHRCTDARPNIAVCNLLKNVVIIPIMKSGCMHYTTMSMSEAQIQTRVVQSVVPKPFSLV